MQPDLRLTRTSGTQTATDVARPVLGSWHSSYVESRCGVPKLAPIGRAATLPPTRAASPLPRLPLLLRDATSETAARLKTHGDVILRLARLESAEILTGDTPKGAVQFVLDEATAMLPLADAIDLDGERERLRGELADVDAWIGKLDAKLSNEKFTSRAPEHVVEAERERRVEAAGKREKLAEALARLDDAA